jgi:F-type H+-transporting ATPase subunit delta
LNEALARRYAAALADVALEERNADVVEAGLASFTHVFFESDDLRNFVESPGISPESKRRAIEEIVKRMGLSPALRNFICIIVDHRRTEMLREITAAFRDELNARLGIADAEVISARALTDAEKKELTAALEQRTGKKIEASFRQDETLLGGAVVRLGSTIYDGSVREQLDRLRERLVTE